MARFLAHFHVLRSGLVNSYHPFLLLFRISSVRQAPSVINFKEFEIRSFKPWGTLFATLVLFWILQVCCGICPPMTSWNTCWLEKPCRRWLKLFSSLTLAGQIEITRSQVFYLTLISSTMPRDAWGESRGTQNNSDDKTGLYSYFLSWFEFWWLQKKSLHTAHILKCLMYIRPEELLLSAMKTTFFIRLLYIHLMATPQTKYIHNRK